MGSFCSSTEDAHGEHHQRSGCGSVSKDELSPEYAQGAQRRGLKQYAHGKSDRRMYFNLAQCRKPLTHITPCR